MPSFDAPGMDPDLIVAELDAIDATLAGEPVDPSHAELAELALLLADTAPRPEPEFTANLDRRVARRFAPLPEPGPRPAGSRRRLPRWAAGPGLALVAAGVAVVVVVGSGGFGSSRPAPVTAYNSHVPQPLGVASNPIATHSQSSDRAASGSATSPSVGATPKAFPPASAKSQAGSAGLPTLTTATTSGANYSASSAASGNAGLGAQQTEAPTPLPGTTGKVIQSASIALTTPNADVDQVAQEVYNVVGQQGGTVTNSQITAATPGNGGGYASFTLSFPTSNLQAAMTALSRLHDASVASRTDGTQNVGGQFNADQANLQQAQALRTSLLKQLQDATTQTAIDAIQAQLKTADAQIASAQSTLNQLQHSISHSTVSVQINSGGVIIDPGSTTPTPKHGFNLSTAGHDAVRVLVVSVGVGLIALAVLVPLSLLAALIAWVSLLTRRRRREQALDAG